VWINGVKDWYSTTWSGKTLRTTALAMRVATSALGSSPFAQFRGQTDEIAFYSGALSDARIAAHYAAGG